MPQATKIKDVSDVISEPVLYALPQISQLKNVFDIVYQWCNDHLFTIDALQQLIVVSLVIALCWQISRRLEKFLDRTSWTVSNHYLHAITRIFLLTKYETVMLVLLPFALWIVKLVFVAMQKDTPIIDVAATLSIVWTIIRFSSALIQSAFWSKTVSIFLWVIAALHIADWLTPIVEFLDKASVNTGAVKLSLLLVIKSTFFIIFIVWLAGVLTRVTDKLLYGSRSLSPSQMVLFGKGFRVVLFIACGVIVLNFAGIDLTALAIFSGAIGIGIGFGMQRVFANLISGFILLMDRSIKPGDVIAIGDTYGWVNKLGTRCVSILTRDGKEHLIPNEKLITDRVENWSYSDNKVRVKVPVGVAYDSDWRKVKELLLEALRENERVLQKPAPVCLITGFGDNSINFELRFWIDDPANGIMNIRSVVHESILDLFSANGITIPFPQRDIYIHNKAD